MKETIIEQTVYKFSKNFKKYSIIKQLYPGKVNILKIKKNTFIIIRMDHRDMSKVSPIDATDTIAEFTTQFVQLFNKTKRANEIIRRRFKIDKTPIVEMSVSCFQGDIYKRKSNRETFYYHPNKNSKEFKDEVWKMWMGYISNGSILKLDLYKIDNGGFEEKLNNFKNFFNNKDIERIKNLNNYLEQQILLNT